MKKGRSLKELAMEITRQAETKADFKVPTDKLFMSRENEIKFTVGGEVKTYVPTENAHGQIASRLDIPKKYYDKMKNDSPDLLANNVNHWLQNKPEKRLVRTLDGKMRAFLSDRFRMLDNYDLMMTTLPILSDNKCAPVSCEVTENSFYMKALFPKMQGEVKKGDIVQAGIVISNSEVGCGSLRVEPLIYRLVCSNGMISNTSMKKYHVGKGSGTSFEDIQEILQDKTKMVAEAAFWMQVKDIILSVFNQDIFNNNLDRLKAAVLKDFNPDKTESVIEVVKKNYNFTDATGSQIMRNLIEDKDYSLYGLANAVTKTANTIENYDLATELERVGGKIIDLSEKDWKIIAA